MKNNLFILKNTDKHYKVLNFSPTQIIVGGFIILILAGAILLTLPISASSERASFIDALFTATSAACVTGLIVKDTNTFWSPFGKTVIISLIQIGGLGIMSLSTIFSIILRRKIGVKERLTIQESISETSLSGIVRTIKNIIIATFIIESIGAALLSTQFIPRFGIVHGIIKSYFHSISAFCNAGFDLLSQGGAKFVSLVPYQDNFIILLTISGLIITGGMGFIVWKDIFNNRKLSKLSLHTKVVLLASTVLIISGTVLFLLLEWNNSETLGSMSIRHKILNAFFASVTPRTAGFNSINIAEMSDASNFLTIILMFIGAAPGSTGGGIKVTTFSVILFTLVSSIKGNNDVNIMKRHIPVSIIFKSISIAVISFSIIVITTMILNLNNEGTFLECLYEATSAFGTVGLTAGITPKLETSSKIIVLLTMFLGRVGPLSAAIAFTQKQLKRSELYKYPEGRITVG